MKLNLLITGGSGKLGSSLIYSDLFSEYNILAPSSTELDITNPIAVDSFFKTNSINTIIHCAALARMVSCEKAPSKAIQINSIGTFNLVHSVINTDLLSNNNIKFIFISTDGVYAGINGNYSEMDETKPYNIYGWSKLVAENYVRLVSNYTIIRTRFFDPNDIKFNTSPTDLYTSKVSINYLVKAIYYIANSEFSGIINIGESRHSEFEINKIYQKNMLPCSREDLIKETNTPFAKDASMNTDKWYNLKSDNKWPI